MWENYSSDEDNGVSVVNLNGKVQIQIERNKIKKNEFNLNNQSSNTSNGINSTLNHLHHYLS
jgi:hypothetical protein